MTPSDPGPPRTRAEEQWLAWCAASREEMSREVRGHIVFLGVICGALLVLMMTGGGHL